MLPQLYLIRHGETQWSLSGQHTGVTDIPLTASGEAEARELGQRLRGVPFAHVLTSPLQRAHQTCALTGLAPVAESDPALAEWAYGDYEGRTTKEILQTRPGWNIFLDGGPNGETPAQVSDRADRLIARLRTLKGNAALFTHGHFGRVLAVRWIGLPVTEGRHFQLDTASLSIFGYDPHHHEVPVILMWNSNSLAGVESGTTSAIERWENEGGEVLDIEGNKRMALLPREVFQRDAHNLMKKLIIFDLDGTLAESKASLDAEMATLLSALLGIVKVAVISGGDWPQFEKQVLANLPHDEHLKNLSLLPTCGTKFFQYASDWKKIYSEDFTADEKSKIVSSLKQALEAAGFKVEKVWGETIEDRGSQITFSALGQQAPIEEKKKWDSDFTKRKRIKALLEKLIPEFSVRLGGTTSVDVTKPGIDKAYGIQKLRDILGIAIDEMIFIGDALFPGGNDYPAKEAGAQSIQVRDPNETKRVIEAIVACLGDVQPTKPGEEKTG